MNLAIASGVSVVGESAAFSADGDWFAFTARPADGSVGPTSTSGMSASREAHRLTTDGVSVFASWQDDQVIGSGRVSNDPIDGAYEPVSFRIDPETGERTNVSKGLWRPAVDPSAAFAVAWDGSVVVPASDPVDMTAGRGDLRLVRWPADGNPSGTTGEPVPGVSGPISDFDVRWDETGSWLAIWIAEPTDPTIGRLTLLRLDRESGRLTRPDGAPTDVRPCPVSRSGTDGWPGSPRMGRTPRAARCRSSPGPATGSGPRRACRARTSSSFADAPLHVRAMDVRAAPIQRIFTLPCDPEPWS